MPRRPFPRRFLRTSPGLGPDFTRLWWTAAATNLGDGALLAAGPLLISSFTTSPAAVAAGSFAQQLPWLLFALSSGALADRLPRRTLILVVNAVRGTVLAVLAIVVAFGLTQLWPIYLALFLLGAGETLADTASAAVVVSLVEPAALGRANARLFLTFTVGNQLVGPPIGAFLFAVGAALPFGFHAAAFLLTVALLARTRPVPAEPGERRALRADIAEGVRWLWRNPALRMLTLCILVMNLTGVAALAVWVLYARQWLGLSERQFGLLVAVGAVGAIAGSQAYGWLESRLSRTFLLRTGLAIESLTYLVLALTRNVWVAALTMAVFGAHALVWGTVATTVRQQKTPVALLGRVSSVYLLASAGGAAAGSLLGGVVAQRFGLLAPFWIAFAAVAVLAVLAWRRLRDIEPGEVSS
ncbi:MFS transporter [Amycolatopsis anabasis]|uniref:MFS transporter n=1 Tax=Amycolatopsis anabasis TaxID=1840409 RepID=UPI00131AF722|nr:MFS transporter [Amycolatopsis anabasis]